MRMKSKVRRYEGKRWREDDRLLLVGDSYGNR